MYRPPVGASGGAFGAPSVVVGAEALGGLTSTLGDELRDNMTATEMPPVPVKDDAFVS
jgi:hypothetical protein